MFRRIRALFVVLLLIAGTVYLAGPPPTPPPMRYRLPDEVGFLEHRGKRYFLNDLFDPVYRAASDDPFVKQFDEGVKFADKQMRKEANSEFLGANSPERRPRGRSSTPGPSGILSGMRVMPSIHETPWAGGNLEDHE